MTMTKLKIAVGAVLVASVGTALVLEHQALTRLREQNQGLQEQVERLTQELGQYQRQPNLMAEANNLASDQQELERLRNEVNALRRYTNEVARLQAKDRESEPPPAPANKAGRLAQLRDTFRALAGGDPKTALRAAHQLADEVERETALLTLVTEWKHGELDPPRRRAGWVAKFGLEAGLGVELARDPELVVLWANELTEGQSRAVVLEHAAFAMRSTDPAGAVALSANLAAADRPQFLDSVFANWAQEDTDAALRCAEQLSNPAERDAAIKAIQKVTPVGIGAELKMQEDGYAVINRLLPGMPAELSGQLRPGDRILAVAQGDSAFVDARGVALGDLTQAIRGAPGSLLQLQVLPADAPPGSLPRTVSIVRGQIKFKQ